MKKFLRILLIVLFPLGIVFCIGKALFSNKDFSSFLGVLIICGLGILLGFYIGQPETVEGWVQAVVGWFQSLGG